MSMFKPGTKAYSIFNFKCPKCHKGDLYTHPATNLPKAFNMHTHCQNCGQRYVLEPGFYWGAMYVAYALSSGFLMVTFAILFFLIDLNWQPAFYISVGLLLLLYVFIFRLARSIWINIYVNYDAKLNQ